MVKKTPCWCLKMNNFCFSDSFLFFQKLNFYESTEHSQAVLCFCVMMMALAQVKRCKSVETVKKHRYPVGWCFLKHNLNVCPRKKSYVIKLACALREKNTEREGDALLHTKRFQSMYKKSKQYVKNRHAFFSIFFSLYSFSFTSWSSLVWLCTTTQAKEKLWSAMQKPEPTFFWMVLAMCVFLLSLSKCCLMYSYLLFLSWDDDDHVQADVTYTRACKIIWGLLSILSSVLEFFCTKKLWCIFLHKKICCQVLPTGTLHLFRQNITGYAVKVLSQTFFKRVRTNV